MTIGFAGLGLMGRPMAANLLRSGVDLMVYNRSPAPLREVAALGARTATTPAALFQACDTVLLMLADDAAVDGVLGRASGNLQSRVAGRHIVNLGTHAPDYSRRLAAEIAAAGGVLTEAPVSGSRGPAEAAALVIMTAGDEGKVNGIRPLLAPMCRSIVYTGAVPSALLMKLSVNLYLVATVAALAEATNMASAAGLDLHLFSQVIGTGPLGSDVARAKLAKMVSGDRLPEATIRDVCKNAALVDEAAAACNARAPVLRQSRALFEAALAAGAGGLDMAAVIDVLHGEIAHVA